MVVIMDRKSITCTVIGDGMVGKTSLVSMYSSKKFPGTYISTVQNQCQGVTWYGGDQYDVNVVDCAGEHEEDTLRKLAYCVSEVFIVCYSTTDRESFASVKTFWAPEIQKLAKKRPIVLVGLQTDLRKSCHRHVSTAEGQKMAKDIGSDSFFECSSLKQDGVKNVFDNVIFNCLRNRKRKFNLMKRILGR